MEWRLCCILVGRDGVEDENEDDDEGEGEALGLFRLLCFLFLSKVTLRVRRSAHLWAVASVAAVL